MILVVDNYDSFVHNIARYFTLLGSTTHVIRNDVISIADIMRLAPEAIVISPGPCTPDEAGISKAIIEDLSGTIPILGICLGHQCLGSVFGGCIARARHPMHGLATDIRHEGAGLFANLPSPLAVGRYHSLIVEPTTAMDSALTIDAWSAEGEIMAVSHRRHPTYGVQFHPESVLTPSGLAVLGNFQALAKTWTTNRMADAMA